jgi:hypothetical protein
MARTIGFFTFFTILVWSLFSLGAWALLSFGGDLVYRQLDWMFGGNPDLVPAVGSLFRFFQNLGLGLVFVIWAIGALFVWILGTVMRRLVQGMAEIRVPERDWANVYEGDRPMKDVTPPRATRSLPPS